MHQQISVQKIYEYIMKEQIDCKSNKFYNALRVLFLADKLMGVNIGNFIYFWRNNHPISGALASLIYDVKNKENTSIEQFQLREDIEYILEKFNTFINNRPEGVEKEYYIEIISFVVFNYYKIRKDNAKLYFKTHKQGKIELYKLMNQYLQKKNINKYDSIIIEYIIKNLDNTDFNFLTDEKYYGKDII